MLGAAFVQDSRLEAAFAAVPREAFLGPAPWRMVGPTGRMQTVPSNDPVYVYQDVLIALDPARGVNNGSPSLHASLLHHLGTQPGDRVVHIGAGGGYYTAILAELAGPSGHVTAIEFDPTLARAARSNLAIRANVVVVHGDGLVWPTGPADRIYVNFATPAPAAPWIEQLSPEGTLIFPLASHSPARRPRESGHGIALWVHGPGPRFAARSLGPTHFVDVEGPGLAADEDALFLAFKGGGDEFVNSLCWRVPCAPARSWFWSKEWSLSYDPPPFTGLPG